MPPLRLLAASVAFAALCHAAQAMALRSGSRIQAESSNSSNSSDYISDYYSDYSACPGCIESLVVFGDSLSDTGLPFGVWSLDNSTIPLSRLGYHAGRYTNEKVWCEYVAEAIEASLTSFAVGGATVNNMSSTTMVASQLATFAKYAATHSLPKPRVAVIMAGSNDLLALKAPAADLANITAVGLFLDSIPSGMAAVALDLLQQGYSNIVLSNLPPIDLTPFGQKLTPASSALVKMAQAQINQGIKKAVADLSLVAPEATVILFDFEKFVRGAVAEPSEYGLTNVTAPCLVTNATSSRDLYATNVSTCSTPDQYLFWDAVHPASGGHRALAKEFTGLLRKYMCRLVQAN